MGITSFCLEPDSPDRNIGQASAAALREELEWGMHLGLQACLLPLPPKLGNANFAQIINQVCFPRNTCHTAVPSAQLTGTHKCHEVLHVSKQKSHDHTINVRQQLSRQLCWSLSTTLVGAPQRQQCVSLRQCDVSASVHHVVGYCHLCTPMNSTGGKQYSMIKPVQRLISFHPGTCTKMLVSFAAPELIYLHTHILLCHGFVLFR